MPTQQGEPTPTVVICPIRYDGGPRPEDHCLLVELREKFSDSPSQLLGFISVSGRNHWVNRFNPVPSRPRSS